MLRMIKTEVAGKTCSLFFSNEAMFTINEKYPESQDDLSKVIGYDTMETVESAVDIFMILAEAGNAALKYFGYECCELPKREDMKFLTPGETSHICTAIYATIAVGSERTVPPLEDTDLYLLEIEREHEKKTNAKTGE